MLPPACEWAAAQERRILATGQPLSGAQLADARLVGVAEPHHVRLLYIISAVAARLAKAGIDAIPLTQKNARRAQLVGCDPRFR